MKLDFILHRAFLSFLHLSADPECAQKQITHSMSNINFQKQHLAKQSRHLELDN